MKTRASLSVTLLVIGFFCLTPVIQAQSSLAEKIKSVSQNLLEGYTQPIVTAFGTGISTGLFHSATSHSLLGFDLGVRAMWIQIPEMAKIFNQAEVVVCSLESGVLVYDTLFLDSVSTIVGPDNRTDVPASENARGIPPFIPGGFNVSGVPLVMPQLNVGLMFGTEAAIRYIPYTYQDTRIHFLGIGLKQNLNSLPFMKTIPLPIDLAIGGAMQWFHLIDSTGTDILSSQTWNLQFLVSKNLIVFEPFIGVGLEGTKIYFHYNFEYEIPESGGGSVPQTEEINVTMSAQNEHRAMAGFTLKLGIFYLHYDYNFLQEYPTHNGIIGVTLR
ncbi:MAG TPA: DUF6588 family protein [bacterium]